MGDVLVQHVFICAWSGSRRVFQRVWRTPPVTEDGLDIQFHACPTAGGACWLGSALKGSLLERNLETSVTIQLHAVWQCDLILVRDFAT